jgi:DNA-binding MarR family transcriptional regulator
MEKYEDIIFYTLDKSIKTYRQYAQQKLNSAELGITVDQWLVINMIKQNPELSQQEIAERVFKDNASVTRIIELMVQKDYIKRNVSADDRRRMELIVTLRGKRLLEKAERVVRSYRRDALKGITDKELEAARKVLNKIINNCEKK